MFKKTDLIIGILSLADAFKIQNAVTRENLATSDFSLASPESLDEQETDVVLSCVTIGADFQRCEYDFTLEMLDACECHEEGWFTIDYNGLLVTLRPLFTKTLASIVEGES